MWTNITKIVNTAQTFLDKLDSDLSDESEHHQRSEEQEYERNRRLQEPYVERGTQAAQQQVQQQPVQQQATGGPESPLNDSWAFDSPSTKINHKRTHSVSGVVGRGKQSRQQETADVKSSELHLIKSELQDRENELTELKERSSANALEYELKLKKAAEELQSFAASNAVLQKAYNDELVSKAAAAPPNNSAELKLLADDNEITKAELEHSLKHSQGLATTNERLAAELAALTASTGTKDSTIASLQRDLQAAYKAGKKGKKGGSNAESDAARARELEAEVRRRELIIGEKAALECREREAVIDAKTAEIASLGASLTQLSSQLLQAQVRSKELEGNLELALSSASSSKSSNTKAEVEAIHQKVSDVKGMRDSLKADVEQTLSAFSSELREAVGTLSLSSQQKTELQKLKADCDLLQNQLAGAISGKAALEEGLQVARQRDEQHEASTAGLQNELFLLQSQLNGHVETVRLQHEGQLAAAAGRIGELEGRLAEAHARAGSAEKRASADADAAVRAGEAARKRMEADLAAASQASQQLGDKLQQQILDNTSLRRSQTSAEVALASAKEAAAASQAEAKAAAEEVTAVREELRSTSSKLEASRAMVEKRLHEIDTLHAQLKEQEVSLEQLRSSLEQSSVSSRSLAECERTLLSRDSECVRLRDDVQALTTRATKAEEEVVRFSEKKKRDLDNLKKLNEQINLTQRAKVDVERKHREMFEQMEHNNQRADRAEALYEEQRSAIVHLEGRLVEAAAELEQASQRHSQIHQVAPDGVGDSHVKGGSGAVELGRALLLLQEEVTVQREQISNLQNECVSASRQAAVADASKIAAVEEARVLRETSRQQAEAASRRVRDLEEERVRLEEEVDGLERLQLQQPFNTLAAVTQREARTLFPESTQQQQDVECGYDSSFTPDKSKKYDAIALPSFLIQLRYQLMALLPRQYLDRVPPTSKIALYYVIFVHLLVVWSRATCH